jgi:hypothetical protein
METKAFATSQQHRRSCPVLSCFPRPDGAHPQGASCAILGRVRLRVPTAVIKAKCALYLQRGKPATRTHW